MKPEFLNSEDNNQDELRDEVRHEVRHEGEEASALARLLLVDDDEEEFLIIRSLLREVIEMPGAMQFSLEWVGSAQEALAEIENCAHDVYLIDYRLGDVTGLDLIERAVQLRCEAPLILLSGLDDPRVDSRAMRVGATDYLVKDQLTGVLLERTLRYAIAGKKSERELRAAAAQNARLMAAIEAANVGVALSEARDGDNVVTYVNPAFTEMTGYPPPEIVGRTLSLLGARETASELIEKVREPMQNGEAGEGLALNFRRDGSSFWNEGRFAPIPVAPGEPVKYVGFFQDVTARIEAKQAATEARRNLELAQQIAHLGSWSYEFKAPGEVEDGVNFWSDETYRILGYEPNAVAPSREFWMARVHPDDIAKEGAALLRAIAEDQPYGVDCRVVHPNGETRFVQVRAQIERDASGRALRADGTIFDVTERELAERAERELETRLQTVTETAPVIVWALDRAGVFTLSEGHVLRRLGVEPGQVVGQSVFEVYAENADVLKICRRALRGEACEEIMSEAGRTFAVYVGPKLDERGEQIGVVGISYDITEQFAAQQALLESEARFERIMPNVPGVVLRFVREADGRQKFDYVSPACQEIFGVTPAVAMANPKALMGLIVEEDQPAFRASIDESQRSLSDWKLEMRLVLANGERRYIQGEARPVGRADGATVWDGILIDVTASRTADQAIRQSRRALDEAQKLARVGSFTWNLHTRESLWSDELYRIFEMEPNEPAAALEEVLLRYHPDDRENIGQRVNTRLEAGGAGVLTARLIRRDGSIRHMEVRSSVISDESGKPYLMTGSLQDVTERVETERALRESEERYALAMRGTNDGLWDWNLVSDEVYYSPHWKAMIGYGEAEIGSAPSEWMERIHPEDADLVRTQLDAHLSGEAAQCECEYRLRNAQGEYQWMLCRGLALFNEAGEAVRLSGSQTDITERKEAESQLERNAFYDALTGLPNRALFSERLDRTIRRGNRHPEQTFAVLFLDIDRFKKINDSLGHLPGDHLLIEASARFAKCLRPGDTVARLGGDEFAILLDDVGGVDDVHQVAERIHAELEAPFPLDGHEAFVTVSMGIALGQGDEISADELLRSADIAMYRAKGAGRGRHEVFEANMHARAVKMLEMETDLWRALERDELRLHYQPIISLKSGTVVGFEALVRWQHPQRGLVSPGDFIPLAEESGLIVPIGWWVLEEACRQAKAWQDPFGPLWMSVNLSPKQLSQPDILERVRGALERTAFDGHLLKLEITESVIMENTESASQMLRDIKALGVRFSMDDFGTGYSSLSYLHRFPLDTIKIDRSFVSQMTPGARDHEIVGTIISMSRGLKMQVVAEGVETAQQLTSLREMRCGFAQGFHISRPQPSEQVEELLARGLSW